MEKPTTTLESNLVVKSFPREEIGKLKSSFRLKCPKAFPTARPYLKPFTRPNSRTNFSSGSFLLVNVKLSQLSSQPAT
jgi:hypothetical protein